MKVGDLIKFKGTWGKHIYPGERVFGVVLKIWTTGLTGKQQSCEVLWDNGDYGVNNEVHGMEVVNESR